MSRILTRGAALAVAALLHVSVLPAQQAPDTTPEPLPQDSVEAALEQFRVLDARVNQVQQQVMESDSTLQEEQAAIQAAVEEAMFAAHPELRGAVEERLPAMQDEAAAAQAAQDTAQLQALNQEYQGIMAQVQEAQAEVVQEEALSQRLDEFQDRVMDAMVQMDPEIEGVFDELRVLAGRLDATLGG
jgi:chromosome segregation ATPase